MNKDVFQLWVKALRSGAYKVCKFRMINDKGRYSPIGVLANVLINEYGCGRWFNRDDPNFEGKPPDKLGFSWYYRPEEQEVVEDKIVTVPCEVWRHYTVYLPLRQWFWPGLTFDMQDRIYKWTDSDGHQLIKVADMLEDGYHYK